MELGACSALSHKIINLANYLTILAQVIPAVRDARNL
jgi:hypothetical protein